MNTSLLQCVASMVSAGSATILLLLISLFFILYSVPSDSDFPIVSHLMILLMETWVTLIRNTVWTCVMSL